MIGEESRRGRSARLLKREQRSLRVLVVDDYPDNAESMAAVLRLNGHEAFAASGGHSALVMARMTQPDAVLLDLSMPFVNGYEVAKRLRAWFQDRIILIAISGHGSEEEYSGCLEAGFDRCLVKPADPRIVANLLQELADGP